MKQGLSIFALTLGAAIALAVVSFGAHAQAAADDALYQALGGQDGITRLSDDFVERLVVDPRIGVFFKDTKRKNLKEQLAAQLCVVSGGPCRYEGDTMKAAHADMGATRADFNTLVEVLQASMDAAGIAFGTQNRLLARLAPMHRDIVTR